MFLNRRAWLLAGIVIVIGACAKKEEEAPAPAAPAPESAATETAPAPTPTPEPTPAPPPPVEPAPAPAPVDPLAHITGEYGETIKVFREAGASGSYFDNSYGFALFPTVGKAGLGVGGAHGKGRVYVGGQHVGDTKLTQLSIGLQAGAEAYSEIIFFEDQRAFDEFSSGNFELSAQASAVVITAAASAEKSTTGGGGATASGGKHDAATAGGYDKGAAVFVVSKGGLMYEASVAGQKFKYEPI